MAFGRVIFHTPKIHRGTVLVVDDDPISLEVSTAMLVNAGWTVEATKNGVGVLNIINSRPIDAVILGMRVPELDGCEVCLRLHLQGMNIPSLAITSCNGAGRPPGYLNASRTFTKPLKRKDILNFVEKSTGRKFAA